MISLPLVLSTPSIPAAELAYLRLYFASLKEMSPFLKSICSFSLPASSSLPSEPSAVSKIWLVSVNSVPPLIVRLALSPTKENEEESSVPPVTETAFLIFQCWATLNIPSSTLTVPHILLMEEFIFISPPPVFLMAESELM